MALFYLDMRSGLVRPMTWIVKRRRIAANQYFAGGHDVESRWVHAQYGARRFGLHATAQACADEFGGSVVRLVPKKKGAG